jgi:anti-sigma regulatory factor (Ser/Thr protein kinase)
MSSGAAVELSRSAASTRVLLPSTRFRHELLCYCDGDHGFVEGTLELVRQALAAGAGVLVAVRPARAAALREALGDDAGRVGFAEMARLGRNPARIIPALREFIGEHGGEHSNALGIGESVWPGRSAAELAECERHEALLNLAFDGGPGWQLLCPYDVDGLDDDVIDSAMCVHPLLARDGETHRNHEYEAAYERRHPFEGALPAPAGTLTELAFARGELARVRRAVAHWASQQALDVERADELVLAIDELATNSIRYGGGAGVLRCWREAGVLLCEVQDGGSIDEPLVGRSRPTPESRRGRGVWLVNQLCDLVQIRAVQAGSVVRVHKSLR